MRINLAVQLDRLPVFGMQLAATLLFGFGVTLLGLSLAYARDLALLQQAPEALWQFVCGIPLREEQSVAAVMGGGYAALTFGGLLLGLSMLPGWIRPARALAVEAPRR